MHEQITRSKATRVELLRNDNKRIIRGTAIVWYDGTPGTEYELWDGVFERMTPEAVQPHLGETIWAYYNHDENRRLGVTPDSLRLWMDRTGLQYEITLPDTTVARDAYAEAESNLLRGSSFRAYYDPAKLDWSKDGNKEIATVRNIAALVEISPVYSPAYTATTTGVKRSHEQWTMAEAAKMEGQA